LGFLGLGFFLVVPGLGGIASIFFLRGIMTSLGLFRAEFSGQRAPMASKGRKKPTIRDLSRHWPTHDEIMALLKFLDSNQPSIVVAILAVAMLEYDLERILRPKFKRSDDATWARITGDNGPLNTFSQKINLAYAFGVLDDERRKSLIVIKNIRNVFAHSKKLVNFDDGLIIDELLDVKIANKTTAKAYKRILKPGIGMAKPSGDPKNAFIYLSLIISSFLSRKATQPLKALTTKKRKALARILAQPNPLQVPFQQASAAGGGGILSGLYSLGSSSPGVPQDYANLIARYAKGDPDKEGKE